MLVFGVLVPGCAGLVSAVAERRLSEARREQGGVEVAATLCVCIGFVAGWGSIRGFDLSPSDPVDLLPFAALLGLVLGAADVLLHTNDSRAVSRIRQIAPLVACLAIAAKLAPTDQPFETQIAHTLIPGAAMFGAWRGFDGLANWLLPPLWSMVLAAWVGGMAFTLSGGESLGLPGALCVLATALLGLVGAAWLNRHSGPAVDAVALPVVLVTGAALIGAWQSNGASGSAMLTGLLTPLGLLGLAGFAPFAELDDGMWTILLLLALFTALTATAVVT